MENLFQFLQNLKLTEYKKMYNNLSQNEEILFVDKDHLDLKNLFYKTFKKTDGFKKSEFIQ